MANGGRGMVSARCYKRIYNENQGERVERHIAGQTCSTYIDGHHTCRDQDMMGHVANALVGIILQKNA